MNLIQHIMEDVRKRLAVLRQDASDALGRPVGIVHARDLARALLNEVNEEDTLLYRGG